MSVTPTDVLSKPPSRGHAEGRAWSIDDCDGCRVHGGGRGWKGIGGYGSVVENRAGTEEIFRHFPTSESYI